MNYSQLGSQVQKQYDWEDEKTRYMEMRLETLTQREQLMEDIETIIEGLEDAISICQKVDGSNDYERSYPYATGYSYGTMQNAIANLKQLLNA